MGAVYGSSFGISWSVSLFCTEYREGWALSRRRRWSAECRRRRSPLSVELERELRAGDLRELWYLGVAMGPSTEPDGPREDDDLDLERSRGRYWGCP